MSEHNNYLLWENDAFTIRTPAIPHLSYSEGLHLYVAPKREVASAWEDPKLAAKTFELTAKASAIMKDLNLAPWFNIQANGNWGLLPGKTPFFHIHIYGRNKTSSWGKPIILPEAPNTYQNEPMPEKDRLLLINTFKSLLI